MIKIKLDIGGGEIVNTYANVKRIDNHYRLDMPDGSFDNWAIFDNQKRIFYSI